MSRLTWVVLLASASMVWAQEDGPAEWNKQGIAASERDDPEEAIKLYQKAIDGWRAMGPQYDPHRATALINLGQTQCSLGDRRQGAASFEEGVAIYRRTIGTENE